MSGAIQDYSEWQEVADEAHIELQHELGANEMAKVPDLTVKDKVGEEDANLAERLRALRPAT